MIADDLQTKASEFVKKVLTVGVSTLFLTEESLKNLVQEFKLPTEFLTGVLKSAQETKNAFLKNLSEEILTKVGDRMDPKALVDEILTRYEIEFNVKMNFKKKSGDDL